MLDILKKVLIYKKLKPLPENEHGDKNISSDRSGGFHSDDCERMWG